MINLRKFLIVLVESAFDRIESSVPPCVSPDETNSEVLRSYRHGVLETVAATFQSLCASEQSWMMTDLMEISGFERRMNEFVRDRLNDPDVPIPFAACIIDALLTNVGDF